MPREHLSSRDGHGGHVELCSILDVLGRRIWGAKWGQVDVPRGSDQFRGGNVWPVKCLGNKQHPLLQVEGLQPGHQVDLNAKELPEIDSARSIGVHLSDHGLQLAVGDVGHPNPLGPRAKLLHIQEPHLVVIGPGERQTEVHHLPEIQGGPTVQLQIHYAVGAGLRRGGVEHRRQGCHWGGGGTTARPPEHIGPLTGVPLGLLVLEVRPLLHQQRLCSPHLLLL
mmetsp:Transcript_46463/g.83025  ORF Transcript_46463/g.83025 Transcript_46463/m.83025 type:complete len:224 (+) Transcript_46463:317-988(+)